MVEWPKIKNHLLLIVDDVYPGEARRTRKESGGEETVRRCLRFR